MEIGPPRLPPELILQIIEAVLPSRPGAILSASHPATKTLLALTLVSRVTYEAASRLLRQRCVSLDSSPRLGTFLRCLPRLVPTLPPTLSLRGITTLYLRPFGRTLDDQPLALWVRELFCEVCDSLRRLVVDMPFATMDRWSDHLSVRRTLRDGFARLARLEEFVCVRDYPTLSMADDETDVWRLWPELRRLVLFKVPVDNHWFWWDVATLPQLDTVVLPRPRNVAGVNVKDEYFHKLARDDPLLSREIRLVLVDVEKEHVPVVTTRWAEIDPAGRMTVEVYDVPTAFYGDEDADDLCSDWVRQAARNGSLWEWKGAVVQQPGQV